MDKVKFLLFVVVAALISACSGSDSEKALKGAIGQVNASCPSQVDEVTTMVGMADDGKMVIYNMALSSAVDISKDNADDFIAEMKSYTVNGFKTNPEALLFVETLRDCHRGLRYHYTLASSGDSYDVDLTPEEIAAIAEEAAAKTPSE